MAGFVRTGLLVFALVGGLTSGPAVPGLPGLPTLFSPIAALLAIHAPSLTRFGDAGRVTVSGTPVRFGW